MRACGSASVLHEGAVGRNGFGTARGEQASEPAALEDRSSSGRDNPMTYRTVAMANAVASAVFGLASLLVPTALASLYAITFDDAAVYAARLLGASYVGYAIAS